MLNDLVLLPRVLLRSAPFVLSSTASLLVEDVLAAVADNIFVAVQPVVSDIAELGHFLPLPRCIHYWQTTAVGAVWISVAVEVSPVQTLSLSQPFSFLEHEFGKHELADAVRKPTVPAIQEVKVKFPGGN